MSSRSGGGHLGLGHGESPLEDPAGLVTGHASQCSVVRTTVDGKEGEGSTHLAPRSEQMEEGIWAVGDYRPKAQGANKSRGPAV